MDPGTSCLRGFQTKYEIPPHPCIREETLYGINLGFTLGQPHAYCSAYLGFLLLPGVLPLVLAWPGPGGLEGGQLHLPIRLTAPICVGQTVGLEAGFYI
jgi:hypothetical protein